MRHLAKLYSARSHFFFICFTSHLFVIFASKYNYILLFIFILSSKHHIFQILFESRILCYLFIFSCSHHPLMLVGEALMKWWSGTIFLSPKPGAMFRRRALSLSLVFFWRSLGVLHWCNASLRGGGILPTPFILLSGRR